MTFCTFICLVSLVMIGAFSMSFPAQSEPSQSVLYDCPYLNDPDRQKLSPMTQGQDGWFFRRVDFQENYTLLPETLTYFKRIDRAFEKLGTKLVVAAIPPRPFIGDHFYNRGDTQQKRYDLSTAKKSYNEYLSQLRSTGITVVDGLDLVQEQDTANDLSFFFKRDHHWTPFGSKMMAQKIAREMNAEASAANTYQTKQLYITNLRSYMSEEIKRLCLNQTPHESHPVYRTERSSYNSEDLLFGDSSSDATIALLGSSFSDMESFNFVGFLMEASGMDVANYSLSGGQLFNAIVSYTSLPLDRRPAPKFALWETLSHYDFNVGEAMYRQIIPAVGGECSREQSIAAKAVAVKGNDASTLLDVPESKKASGHDYYLFIESDTPSLVKFTVEFDYADGDGEWFTIDRSENFRNKGRFFIELSDELTAPLTQVSLDNNSPVDAKLDVRLCKAAL